MTHKSNNSPVSKAVRKNIFLGMTSITAYMLPDGTYTLASSSITKAIHKRRFSLSEFLDSKSVEALACKCFSLCEFSEISTENSVADIKPVPQAERAATPSQASFCSYNPNRLPLSARIAKLAAEREQDTQEGAFTQNRILERKISGC